MILSKFSKRGKFIAWRVKKILKLELVTKQEQYTENVGEFREKSLQDT